MQYKALGRTGYEVSTISFGAWAIGGTWGDVNDAESMQTLHKALDLGVNFFDTADVYGDGHSERLLARLRKERKDPFWVATKVGRRSSPHTAQSYTRENLTAYVERCLRNLDTPALDLLQLHCPPTDVFYMPEVFGVCDDLVKAGKVRFYGVSIERAEEGLKALEYPQVQSVQVVFNVLRQRPAELLFPRAVERQVGILARLPLSSGMLTGKLTRTTQFAADDHRSFNREGAAFDKGETFSGFDYEKSLAVVETLRMLLPPGMTLPELALRFIASFPAVTCSIPGARRTDQIEQNVFAGSKGPLPEDLVRALRDMYERDVKPSVHQRW
ncbi:MAG: aldo/keto reductase [Myxococcales bacterium]|nr:MAG: aldo/keto reductase [Myxococcales bacterium]